MDRGVHRLVLDAGGPAPPVKHYLGSYVRAVLKDSPVVLWPLDDPVGTTTVRDLSGNGNQGTVAVGHQILAFGEPGYTSDGATALQTGGPGDFTHPAAIANTSVPVGAGNVGFTIEIVVGGYSYDDGGNVAGIAASENGEQGWGFWLEHTFVSFFPWSGPGWKFTSPLDVAASALQHFALTYDPVLGPAAMLNGVPLALARTGGSPVVNLTLPGVYVDGLPNLGDDGSMTVADVAVYNYTLTVAQIAAHVAAR